MKKLKVWNIDRSLKAKKSKINLVEEYKSKIWDSTQIYDSGRISRATDKGMNTKAHDVDTPKACSSSGPWEIGLVMVKIQSYVVSRIVWNNLYRTQLDPLDLVTYKEGPGEADQGTRLN
jgi:hypothetical protein